MYKSLGMKRHFESKKNEGWASMIGKREENSLNWSSFCARTSRIEVRRIGEPGNSKSCLPTILMFPRRFCRAVWVVWKSSSVQLTLISSHLVGLKFKPIRAKAGIILIMCWMTESGWPPIVVSSKYQTFKGEVIDFYISPTPNANTRRPRGSPC